ncbi:hypothetical protein QUF58_01425 [Anaerolineales bacterium HSG24]|nr:hypothetical protein [Anaerolineales bacterium HSG24]
MVWPPRRHFETLIAQAKNKLPHVNSIKQNIDMHRAIIDIEATWQKYRVVIQEIHRPDNTIRYSYYLFTEDNQLKHGFDNSCDRKAIRLKYGETWREHLQAEIPHQHDHNRQVTLTDEPMTYEKFVVWLTQYLGN